MGSLSLVLSFFLFHSFFDIKDVAHQTISRLPASLISGSETPELAPQKKAIDTIKLSCLELKSQTTLKVQSSLVQLQIQNCGKQTPVELINLTNGFQATLFSSPGGALSDLISLNKGSNEIHVRLEKAPLPFSVQLQLEM